MIDDEKNDGVEVLIESVIEPVTRDETGAVTRDETGAVTRDETGAVTKDDIVAVTRNETEVVTRSETEAVINREVVVPEALGVGLRKKTMPVKLNDYVLHNVSCDIIEEACLNDVEEYWYPLSKFDTLSNFSEAHCAFLTAVMNGDEPTLFRDAVALKVWRDAMGFEVDALEKNKTWEMTELPEGKVAIGSMWVYKIKYKSDGTIERYKARLVALGNKQI